MIPFKMYLEERRLEDTYLEKHIDFSTAAKYTEGGVRKYGYTAKQSNKALMGTFVNYLEEPVEILNDKNEKVLVKRVQTIDDIWLLSEIIAYTENTNCDRISGALGGIGLIHVLVNSFIYPKGLKTRNENEIPKPPQERRIQFFNTNTRPNRFSPRRLM
jgi:hypothetical protein